MPRKPGLPSGFKVGTKKEHLETPAVGGSFLEETLGLSTPSPVAEPEPVEEEAQPDMPEASEERVVQLRPRQAPVEVPQDEPAKAPPPKKIPKAAAPPQVEVARPEAPAPEAGAALGGGGETTTDTGRRTARERATPPRKQINLKPNVISMAEELLDLVRDESGQKDAASSEMFEGLVLALQEAKPHLVLNSVPPRGAWGSKTARAFPVSLKKQFVRAIGKLYLESYREGE